MNLVKILFFIVQLALAFFLGLFPLHQAAAQQESAPKDKVLRIRVLKEQNGQTQVLDTTLQVAEEGELFRDLEELPVDSLLRHRLNDVLILDSSRVISPIRTLIIKDMKVDTAALRKLHGDGLRIYKLDSLMSAVPVEALRRKVNVLRKEVYPILSDSTIRLKADSAANIYIRELNPQVFFRDSLPVSEELANIERVIVRRGGSDSLANFLVAPDSARVHINIVQDKRMGEEKVYRIDENGRKEELKADILRPGHIGARIVVVRKAKVEDMTAEDKQLLKEAGAAVETKAREALEIKDISFYPNPNSGRFQLSFTPADKETTRVSVMDGNGEEVFVDTVEQLSGQYSRQLDLTPFGPGIYYLQIRQGHKSLTKKILVQ